MQLFSHLFRIMLAFIPHYVRMYFALISHSCRIYFTLFISCSLAYGSHDDSHRQSNTTSFNLHESAVNSEKGFDQDKSGTTHPYIKKRRKEKRLQFGEDMLLLSLETALSFSNDTYYASLIVAAPIFVVGSGFIIWGALTKDPSRIRVRARR